MAKHLCPWWLGYFLLSPLRRIWHDPVATLKPWVQEGMTVLEPGCGMGYYTLEAARRVGPTGRVVALDLQPRMLAGLRRRAEKAGLAGRIDIREVRPDRLGIEDLEGAVDLAFVLHVLHEVEDQERFLGEIRAALMPTGRLLLVEPRGHVSAAQFEASLALAERAGLRVVSRPVLKPDLAALLEPDATTAASGQATR